MCVKTVYGEVCCHGTEREIADKRQLLQPFLELSHWFIILPRQSTGVRGGGWLCAAEVTLVPGAPSAAPSTCSTEAPERSFARFPDSSHSSTSSSESRLSPVVSSRVAKYVSNSPGCGEKSTSANEYTGKHHHETKWRVNKKHP